jgi:signal transduction histidine kinase
MVLRSAERVRSMRKLITDLLDLTRIESGSKKQIHEKFDWLPLLENVAETARVSADPRGIGIRIRNREPFFAVADPSDLEMIANNLVSNAVKYNRDGGSVDLSLRRDGEVLSIEVADTGIGISEEDRGKLFSEFSRIRNAQTARIAGSGLGLSIVRKLAGLYGGDVSLQSRPGEGTVVTVRLREPKEKEHVQENPRH